MHSKLVEIQAVKQKEVAELKKKGLPYALEGNRGDRRDFKGAIYKRGRINLISEIKFASPSAGMIRERMDPNLIGRTYERAGASAISFLTDHTFFRGDINDLPKFREAVTLPILRKDFIIDEIQVKESVLFGADAVLLISSILSKERLKALLLSCRDHDLAALTEVHDGLDLEKALDCGAEIIGINNRNLDTFEIDIRNFFNLAPQVPKDHILVCESGIHEVADIERLKGSGAHAVLVGSALMASGDIEGKTRALVTAGKRKV